MIIYNYVAFWCNKEMAAVILTAEQSGEGQRVCQGNIPRVTRDLSQMMKSTVTIINIFQVSKDDYDAWQRREFEYKEETK